MVPFRRWAIVLSMVTATGQQPPPTREEHAPRMKQSQLEDLLKEEHRKSLEDAAKILELSEELKAELEKSDRHVLSVCALRKAEDIEKLAKRIRSRMRRF